MHFRDRGHAARMLAAAIGPLGYRNPLVLGIPRGGVPMARVIADQLDGEVDVILVRKLAAPGNPEYAVGSVDEAGWLFLTPSAEAAGATPAYLQAEKAHQLETIRERRAAYTAGRAAHDPAGRVVIVVDDGLATGSTMIAALHGLRGRKPAKLVCAVPVSPPDAIERIRPYADEVVCLFTAENFHAVGQFYRDFPQVSDSEVIKALTPPSTLTTGAERDPKT